MDIVSLNFHLLEPIQQATAMIQQGMHNDTRAEGKGEEVCHGIGGWEVQGRVIIVSFEIECIVDFEDSADVVGVPVAVEGLVGGYGEVGKHPRLARGEKVNYIWVVII
jgi:hypothetical protein